jgi:NAD(P)-dependent dehydrogenase (short-subunit alcohol dehydrogenase family)
MRDQSVLVTGACGEIGQALVQSLADRGFRIVTADLVALPDAIQSLPAEHIQGDLVNRIKVFYDYDFDIVFHLAASLSSKADIATEEALPRPGERLHHAQRRDERLRSGDAALRRGRKVLRLFRRSRHAHPVHGHAGCHQVNIAADGCPPPQPEKPGV